MDKLAVIEIFSHGVRISRVSPAIDAIVREFCKTFAHYKLERTQQGHWQQTLFKIYGVINKTDRSVLFHRNQYADFWQRCLGAGYGEDRFDIRNYVVHPGISIDLKVQEHLSDLEHQPPIIEYLTANEPGRTAEVQTGKGKSYCFCKAMALDGQRGGLIILPRFLTKWIEDLGKNLQVTGDDILVIKDGKTLIAAMERARDGTLPDFKIAIFSLSSLDIWLKYFEEVDAETYEYPFTPQEFMHALGIGTLGFDEVHMAAHQAYNCMIHFHVRKQIYLSATLKHDDQFVTKMFNVSMPVHTRYKTPEWDKYIDVVAIEYGMRDAHKIKTSYRRREYNHAAFEDSLRRNRKMFKQYMELIYSVVKNDYLSIRQDGMKMLIFAAKKETCEAIVGYIKKRVEGMGLSVSKYVSEDAYSVLIDSDITASTLGSSGTAVDIPNLVKVLMTTNISAITANQQAVGRLRKLRKWENVPLEFFYLYCRDIPKHVEYHMKKINDLEDVVKSHRTVMSSVVLDSSRD